MTGRAPGAEVKTGRAVFKPLLALLCMTTSGSAGGQTETLLLQPLPLREPPALILRWSGVPGHRYLLETSSDLTTWTAIDDLPQTGTGELKARELPLEGNRRFFRLVRLEAPKPDAFARIPSGSFVMGDAFAEGMPSELPLHTVELTDYWIARHPVTWREWQEIYDWGVENGYQFSGNGAGNAGDHPVHSITWHDAVKWCNARSERENLDPVYFIDAEKTAVYRAGEPDLGNEHIRRDGSGYRLPTEAEWEKAARGGLAGMRFPWGNMISHEYANYWADFPGGPYDQSFPAGFHPEYALGALPYTNPVEAFPPNAYGLHGMAGNVWEWVWDRFGEDYYASSPANDPHGPNTGNRRVARGGSWVMSAIACRVSDRFSAPPGDSSHSWGFRVAKN